MTDREKLIELMIEAESKIIEESGVMSDEELDERLFDGDGYGFYADHLIANGVRLEPKQATSDENKRWIPVSERLPEHEDAVLCLIKNGQQEILQLDKFENLWVGMQWTYKRHAVTHWMPLPNPPKEERDAGT